MTRQDKLEKAYEIYKDILTFEEYATVSDDELDEDLAMLEFLDRQ